MIITEYDAQNISVFLNWRPGTFQQIQKKNKKQSGHRWEGKTGSIWLQSLWPSAVELQRFTINTPFEFSLALSPPAQSSYLSVRQIFFDLKAVYLVYENNHKTQMQNAGNVMEPLYKIISNPLRNWSFRYNSKKVFFSLASGLNSSTALFSNNFR